MNKVSGVPLLSFEDPIRDALTKYSKISDGRVGFDIDEALKLSLTPGKPNSARSVSEVQHLGETAGTLYVIAFAPEDGTGDESTYKLDDTMTCGLYPRESKVIPRSKAAVHSEAHLTIASQFPHQPDNDPALFAGHLDLVSFKDERLARLAYLGQHLARFGSSTNHSVDASPKATLTTGFRESNGERFGDPHAVFNATELIQVCGFVAVANNVDAKHIPMLSALGAVEPELRF